MSCTSVLNSNTINKKCGEIIITMKKNSKNVYSFNCWFCDTIHIQMKKFTLHLEKEHNAQLEQTTSNKSELNKDHYRNENLCENESIVDNTFINEIKIEECENAIKLEEDEKNPNKINLNKKLPTNFQDPLEMYENNLDEIAVNIPVENNTVTECEENKNEHMDKEQSTEDVHMDNLTDDEQNEYHSDYSDENNSSDSDTDNINENQSKTIKSNTKAKEKELVLALIEAYYKNPQLWDTKLSEKCNLKQKEEIFQKITDEINEKLNIKLKLYMVKKKLNSICKQYEKEIEKQMNTTDNNKILENTELWFYENMSFLKSIVEGKLQIKKKKPNHKVKPLNDNVLCDLIDIYKNYNSLWDVNHLAYTVKDKRHETMQSMLDEVKTKLNIPLDIYKLEKHLNYIHKTFSKDKQFRFECEAKQQDFQPSCSYFDRCDFLETNQGPFRCTICNEIIDTYNDFQIHKSQHDGSIPFKCQECGMGFKKITNYTIHAKRHLRVFKFHCEICGKGYPFNAELDLHMRSHTGAQPYLCSVCGEGFRTAISYDNHIRRHEERFKYFCHICKKGFNHMTRLNDHVKAHLNVRDIICTVCGKGFTSRKYLNHHKRIHEGKNYSCNICGKSFAQDAGLRAHKKYHGTPIGISSIQKEQNKYKL